MNGAGADGQVTGGAAHGDAGAREEGAVDDDQPIEVGIGGDVELIERAGR